jgi:glycosyltransferase involved in cell wall biosynthesis
MTEPLVSVMMITYNHAPYIRRAIEGALQQKTSFPFEVIIGEDCSTDGTREVVFEYQLKYPDKIRVITSTENVGAKQNASRVGKACRGKFIAFCEGDDYWHHPFKLQKQVDYMERHPECGLVYSSFDVHYVDSGRLIKDRIRSADWEMPENPNVLDFLDGESGLKAILTCTVMIRRAIAERIGETDAYLHKSGQFLMGDTQLWAEMINAAPVYYIPESLATYRRHGESLSNNRDIEKRLQFQISNSEMMLYLCDKYNAPARVRKKHEDNKRIASLRLAFQTKDAELADEVRKGKHSFGLKEWLFYIGARNSVMNSALRVAALLRKKMSLRPLASDGSLRETAAKEP